jgi:hypothetical protein
MPDRSSLYNLGLRGNALSETEARRKYPLMGGGQNPTSRFWFDDFGIPDYKDARKRAEQLGKWHPDSPTRALLAARVAAEDDVRGNVRGRAFKFGPAYDISQNEKMLKRIKQESASYRTSVLDPLVKSLQSPDYIRVLNDENEKLIEDGFRGGLIDKQTRDNIINQFSKRHVEAQRLKVQTPSGAVVPAPALRSGRNYRSEPGDAQNDRALRKLSLGRQLADEKIKQTRVPQGVKENLAGATAVGGMLAGGAQRLNQTYNPFSWAAQAMGTEKSMDQLEKDYRARLEETGEDTGILEEAYFGGGAGALQAVANPAIIGGNIGAKATAGLYGQSTDEAQRVYDNLGINQWYSDLTGDPTNLDRQVARISAMNIIEQVPLAGSNLVGMQIVGNAVTRALLPAIKTSTALNAARMGGMMLPGAVQAVGAGFGDQKRGSKGEIISNFGNPIEYTRKIGLPEGEYDLKQQTEQSEGFGAQKLAMTLGMFGGGANQFYKDATKLFSLSRDLGKLGVFGRVAKVNPASVEGQKMLMDYYSLQAGVAGDAAFGLSNVFDPVARQFGSNFNPEVQAPTVTDWLTNLTMAAVAVRPAKGLQGFIGNKLGRGVDIAAQTKFYAQDMVERGGYHATGVNARFGVLTGGQEANSQDLQRITSYVYETAAQEFVNQDRNSPTFKSLDAIFFDIINNKSESSYNVDNMIRQMRVRGDNSKLPFDSPLSTLAVNPALFPVTPLSKAKAVNQLGKTLRPVIQAQYDMYNAGQTLESVEPAEVATPDKQYFGVLRGNVDGVNEYIVYNKYFSDATLHRGDDGLEDVQIINSVDVNKQKAQARIETLANSVAGLKRDFNSRQNQWTRDGVIKAIGGIRKDGTIIVKTKKAGRNADVGYTYMSFDQVQKELSRENRALLAVLDDLYTRTKLSRTTSNSSPLPTSETGDNFPTQVNIATGELVNGRLIASSGLTMPIGIYQLIDGSVVFGPTPEGGAEVLPVLNESSASSTPELFTSSVIKSANDFIENGAGYIEADIYGTGVPSKLEITPDLGDVFRAILDMEIPDSQKAEMLVQRVVADMSGEMMSGNKALRYDAENNKFVADVTLKPGDRVVFRTADAGLRDVSEGVVVEADNGVATVKLKDDPLGPAYTLSADRFALSESYQAEDVLQSKSPTDTTGEFARPAAITSADEAAIAQYLAYTANVDVGTQIASSKPEDLFTNIREAIVNTRATPAGIQRGLLEWAMRNNVEDVQDAIAQVISDLSAPGKEVDIATFSKAMAVYSDEAFNELLYRIMSVHQSIDPKFGTLFAAGDRLPQFGTIAKRTEALQIARRMNLLMLNAGQRTDADIFKRALTSLGFDPKTVESNKVINLAKQLRGIAPHVFYYIQDKWHVDKLSAASHASQATLGRAIAAVGMPDIVAQIKADRFIPDSAAEFWQSKDKFDKAVRDVRGLLKETRTETFRDGDTERYEMRDIVYARLRTLGLEFLYHMASDVTSATTRRLIQNNPQAASEWHRASVSYMYDTYLPDVAIETINAKILSGQFMVDGTGTTDQTNNISFAPEIRGMYQQIVDGIAGDIRIPETQRQAAIDKVNRINELLDSLSDQEIELLRAYDKDGKRQLRLFSDVEVNGEIKKDQPANLRVASADQAYRESTARAARESGMSMSEAQIRAHEVYVQIFKNNARKIFTSNTDLRSVVLSIESDPTFTSIRERINDLSKDYALNKEKITSLYDELDAFVIDTFNSRIASVRDTLGIIKELQPPVKRLADADETELISSAFMTGTESDTSFRYEVEDDGSYTVYDDSELNVAVTSVFDVLNTLQSAISRRDQLSTTTSLDAMSADAEPVMDSVTSLSGTDILLIEDRIKSLTSLLSSARPEEVASLQRQINVEQIRLAQERKTLANTGTTNDRRFMYKNYDYAINNVIKLLGDVSSDQIGMDVMLAVYGKFTSLLPSNSDISNSIKNDLTVTYAAQNIMLEDSVRRLRVSGVTSDVRARASLSDVIRLQAGDLTPAVFAEQYGISQGVAEMIAKVEAYNKVEDTEPTIVNDGDMTFGNIDLVPDDMRAFVSTSPDIVQELVKSQGPNAFDGMIESPDDQIVAYSAQNFEGMRILMRSMLAKAFSDADAQHATEVLSRSGDTVTKLVNDTYVSPMYIADKLEAVGGKFLDLAIDDDVAGLIDGIIKSTIKRYTLTSKSNPAYEAVQVAATLLKNMPDIRGYPGSKVAEYYDVWANRSIERLNLLNGQSPEDAMKIVSGILKDINPDTNARVRNASTTLADMGARPVISTGADAAFTARRILASLKQAGIPLRLSSESSFASVEYANLNEAHSKINLGYVPHVITQVSPELAGRLSTLYADIINGLPATPDNARTIETLTGIKNAYTAHAETGGDVIAVRQKVSKANEAAAMEEYADNLAAMYDINALSYAREQLAIKLSANHSREFKDEVAEALRITGVSNSALNDFLQPQVNVNLFLTGTSVTPEQKNYALTYLTAKYKKDYYTKHNKVLITNQELLEEVGATARRVTADKRDVFGFTQSLAHNQGRAIKSLIYIGSKKNSPYRTALTLTHEMFHPLFTGMADSTQVEFLDSLVSGSSLMDQTMTDELGSLARSISSTDRVSVAERVEAGKPAVQKQIDRFNNPEMALALQIKVAREALMSGRAKTLEDALKPLSGITYRGEDLANGWISHGHEKFVTGMLNFITDYTVVQSRNAAASIDSATLSVFQQMRSTLRYVMRQIHNQHPLDVIYDEKGSPHAAWYMPVPMQKYTLPQTHLNQDYIFGRVDTPRGPFYRELNFAQMQKGNFLRVSVPTRDTMQSEVVSPVQMMRSIKSVQANDIEFGGSPYMFGFQHTVGDQSIHLPFSDPTLRRYLLENPGLIQTVQVNPFKNRYNTRIISPQSMPTKEYTGRVVDMIAKTTTQSPSQARLTGYEPAYYDGVNTWVRGETDNDGWFVPRLRANTEDPKAYRYAIAGQHEYAYVVEAPAVITVGDKEFRSQVRFLVGEKAFAEQNRSTYDPILVGYTQEFDPKFSALIYDTHRKINTVLYDAVGNVRWKKQLDLEKRLLSNNASSFTMRTSVPLGESLDRYFASPEYKAVSATRMSMQPQIIDGANQFDALLDQIVSNRYSVKLDDGTVVPTEAGEAFVSRLDNAISTVLSPYIADNGLFRHDRNQAVQTNSWIIQQGSPEQEAMFSVFQAMLGGSEDLNVLRTKLINAYSEVNTRGSIRADRRERLDSIMSKYDIPTTVTLQDGREFQTTDLVHNLLRNEKLAINNVDAMDIATRATNFYDNVIGPILETGELKSDLDLQQSKPMTSAYVLDTLMNVVYGNSVAGKANFLDRLSSSTNQDDYGDVDNDPEAATNYQNAMHARNSAYAEFMSVAHALDAQSREIGRALYAWKDWSLVGDKSFPTNDAVIIRDKEGALYRVNLNNPENFVESAAFDFGRDQILDHSPFSRTMALYNPEHTPVRMRADDMKKNAFNREIGDVFLTSREYNELITSSTDSIDIIRPFGVDNNQTQPGLNFFRVSRKTIAEGGRRSYAYDPSEEVTLVPLKHGYKSQYTKDDGEIVNNQRLQTQAINHLMRLAFANNPDADPNAIRNATNTAIIPREVMIAKLLVARALINGDTSIPSTWKKSNAQKSASYMRLSGPQNEAYVDSALSSTDVYHNRKRTWLSDGADHEPDLEAMSETERAYFDLPLTLSPEDMKNPDLVRQYKETQFNWALQRAYAVPPPKSVVVKREANPNMQHVAMAVKNDSIYITIPDSDYDYTVRTMFSADGPTGPSTPVEALKNLPAGAAHTLMNGPVMFSKRGGGFILGGYHEVTSLMKAAVLSVDFARPMLQNFRLTALNPKNFAAQFWGLSALLPNLWWFSGGRARPMSKAGQLAAMSFAHRPDLAFGDKQYHAKMYNYLTKYGTAGNRLNYGIIPGTASREVKQDYDFNDLAQYGLKTTYGDWFDSYNQRKLLDPSLLPEDVSIQPTQAENIGDGLLARRILPFVNQFERGGALSTDILRVKSFLEFATYIDNNTIMKPFQKAQAKRDYATFINVVTGNPSGTNWLMSDAQRSFNSHARTLYTSPNWFDSQMMQWYAPAAVKKLMADGINVVSRTATRGLDPFHVGWDIADASAEEKWFSSLRTKEVLQQHILTGASALGATAMLGTAFQALGMYMDKRRLHEYMEHEPIDFMDWRRVMRPVYNSEGKRIDDILSFDNKQWWNPIDSKNNYGVVRAGNTLEFALPQTATVIKRTFVSPLIAAANEPSLSAPDKAAKFAREMWQANFANRLGPQIQLMKQMAYGRTFTDLPAYQKDVGLRQFRTLVQRRDALYDEKRIAENENNGKELRRINAELKNIDVVFKKIGMFDSQPTAWAMHLLNKAPNGLSRSFISLTQNLQVQNALRDLEAMAWAEYTLRNTGKSASGDYSMYAIPAFIRPFGQDVKFNDYYLMDELQKGKMGTMSGKAYNYIARTKKYTYPNASNMIANHGWMSLIEGVPESGGYSDTIPAFNKSEPMMGFPDRAVMKESGVNQGVMTEEVKKRMPPAKINLPGDLTTGKILGR